MRKAEAFIKENGGLSKAHFMTKMLLAVNGLYSYPTLFYFPMTYFLLPAQFPFSMYKSSSYARVHLTPMIICLNKKFSVVHHDLDTSFFDEAEGNWFRDERNEWTKYILEEAKKCNGKIVGALIEENKVTGKYYDDTITNKYNYVLLEKKIGE